MLIQELILENFMSYEYARIPLKSGVNVVCGPNGSSKRVQTEEEPSGIQLTKAEKN